MTIHTGDPQVMAGNDDSVLLVKAKKDSQETSATPSSNDDPASTGFQVNWVLLSRACMDSDWMCLWTA